jgi:hypothetical protein
MPDEFSGLAPSVKLSRSQKLPKRALRYQFPMNNKAAKSLSAAVADPPPADSETILLYTERDVERVAGISHSTGWLRNHTGQRSVATMLA